VKGSTHDKDKIANTPLAMTKANLRKRSKNSWLAAGSSNIIPERVEYFRELLPTTNAQNVVEDT
jgi:hypothetical protein